LFRDRRRTLQLATPVSLLCIFAGVLLLLLLPLDHYSRRTYISENALLPGQVHTYFDGSEHNVFRAYRHEVHSLLGKPSEERNERLADIFKSSGLKVATQKYAYTTAAANATGENVYAVLHGPRADATEAIVLIAAWKNMADVENQSGVALVLTLARYFKRWSLWSKDIIFLVTEDSVAGPQAWVDAYHDAHDARFVAPLAVKSGGLQGALAVDYPAGPWGQRFDKLHVVYDGVNGQLPNLDLINTAINVASGQMGIECTLQRMWDHSDRYADRLMTLGRGMLNQALGHATGPHSGFMRYHVDAVTLQTVGDGWHDEMSLGRTVEGVFRSLNNLLEHLHQSFFFYLLMQSRRFVSIGTYLPSAMCFAAAFNIMSIALWWQTGLREDREPEKKTGGATAPVQQQPAERHMFFPLLALTAAHFLGLAPLALFNHSPPSQQPATFALFTLATLPLPALLARLLLRRSPSKPSSPAAAGGIARMLPPPPGPQQLALLLAFCLLLLGMCLAALATVNYALAYLVGLLSAPLVLVRLPRSATLATSSSPASSASSAEKVRTGLLAVALLALSPCSVIWAASWFVKGGLGEVLGTAAFGWAVYGLWTQVVVWLVWWPAWLVGCFVLAMQAFQGR
jgi:glycosylphosphatidylinositol transamidase